MSKKIQLAILGGSAHVKKFGDMVNSFAESQIAGVWNSQQSVGTDLAGLLGCRFYKDVEELLSLPTLNGVIICVPNFEKTDLILKAAKAGKGIFVEKPLANNLSDALLIRDAVKDSGVKFYMTDPFVEPPTMYMKDFIKTGKLGKLQSANVEFCSIMPQLLGDSAEFYRTLVKDMGGGMMCDTGTHPLHAIHYLFGMPDSVYSRFSYVSEEARKAGYEHFVTAVLNYKNEFSVTLNCSTASPRGFNRIEIRGIKGVIVDEMYGRHDMAYTVGYRCFDRMPEVMKTIPEMIYVPQNDFPVAPDDHIRYFVRMLAEGIPNSAVGVDPMSNHGTGIDTAVDLVKMCSAIRESAATGKVISIE